MVADREEKLIEPNPLIRELLARIRAILRRKVDGTASPVFSNGAVQLEPSTREATANNKTCRLTAREFALLQVLLTRPGTILSRDELERWTVVGHDLAALEKAVAEAEVRSERWRPEADAALKRVAARQHWLPGTQEAIAEAEAIAEQRRQEAKVAAKRADGLLAELFEMTSERVEMSR